MSNQQYDAGHLIEQIDAIEADTGEGVLQFHDGTELSVSNLSKVFFPKDRITKGDVMRYYAWIAPYILPTLQDRPLSLRRFPNGIEQDFFFQQKAPIEAPSSVRIETIKSESGDNQRRIIGGSLATLLYTTQLGAIECNPWNARAQSLEQVDYTVIDLDPGPRAGFARVVETALRVKEALDAFGLVGAAKTSGVSGIHIYIPLAKGSSEEVAVRVSRQIADVVAQSNPSLGTTERYIRNRKSTQVYVDAGQNARGKTVAAAYSVRAAPTGLVSTPIDWRELTADFNPLAFNIFTIPDRIHTMGDLWEKLESSSNSSQSLAEL